MGKLLQGCGVIVGFVLLLGILGGIFGSGGKQAPTQSAVPNPTATSYSTATSVSVKTPPQPTATAPPSKLVVGNTDRQGVYVRSDPGGDKTRAWPDGTSMSIIGPDSMADGTAWKNVRAPDGNVGWVPEQYLVVPPTPTPTPVPTVGPSPTPTIDRSQYKLELVSARGYAQYGFAIVEGQVKNISSSKLSNVEVVVEWRTATGEFVKSDEALIEYNPILSGQTSPFKSITQRSGHD